MTSTTTTLTSNPNPFAYGSSVTFTATITPAVAGQTMSGSVTFYNGNVALGSGSVFWNGSTGQATLSFDPCLLLVCSHSLTAVYSGDGSYQSSTSSVYTQTVTKRSPNFSLSSSAPYNTSVYGQTVTFTASYGYPIPGLVPPSGSVTFDDGSTNLGTSPMTPDGSDPMQTLAAANLSDSTLAVGAHSITASYPGDSNYASATASLSFTVNQAMSNATLTPSVNPSALCQPVTFTAEVTAVSPGSGTPTGTVSFQQNGTTVATVDLSDGVAAYSTSALSQGSYSFSANYNGDSNFSSSFSNPVSQTVNGNTDWVLNSTVAAPDPQQGLLISFGSVNVQPLTGGMMYPLVFDANQHTSCDCGCGCHDDNGQAGVTPPSLIFVSSTVNAQPILQTTLASDFCSSVPSQIQAQLTWNGVAQGWVNFDTSGHGSGDVYYLPLQVANAVSSSGIYPWSIEVKATVGTLVYDRTTSGVLPVVVNGSSPYGAGWSLGGTLSLLIGSAGVALIDNSTGGFRYFTGSGPSYTSPANDQGTLVQNTDGSYTYTSKQQLRTNFDSSGRMTSQVDPHGLTQSLSYSGGLLQTLTQPDGGVATFSYSGSLLSSIQTPGGRSLTMTYDGNNNLTGLVDAAGGLYTFSYDGSHRLVNAQVGPLNTTYTYSTSNGTLTQIDRGLGTTLSVAAAAAQGLGASTAINASHAVAALTDGLGHVTSYTLDSLARPTQLQTADGAVQTWTLNSAGNPTAYVDQLGRTTSYAYNSTQDMTQRTYPDGTITSYQYDTTFHEVTQIQDALNNLTTFAYDSTTGDLLTQQDALGNVTTYTWSNGLKQTTTDALGRVTTLQWDSTKRRKTAMTDALGNITSYTYDSAGNQIAVQDALGRYTTMSYDGNRRQLTQMNALGGVRTYTYDAVGNQLTSVDQLGRTTSTVYDQRGLLVSVTEALGTPQQRTTTTTYDAAANVLYTTDALGDITSYAYDALNRPTATLEAYGSSVQRATTTVYDLAGNTLSNIDAMGNITSYAYDPRNRPIQLIEAFGTSLQRTTTTMYDVVGNVLTTTNPRGTVTSFGYDADYRQTQMVEAYGTMSLQRTTTTVYDAVGNMVASSNPVGATTSYVYDALNRQTQMIEAYGSAVQRTTTTAYDMVSNVLSTTNPRGYVTSFAYDALDRRVQEVDAYGTGLQRTQTTVYDAVSNLLSVTNGLGVVSSFAYDALDRRVTELDAFGTSLQRTLTTVYDSDDNVIASIDALGYATTFGYDPLNRQVTVQDAAGGIATTVYDANSNLVNAIDQLGNTTTIVFDALKRKTQTIDARGGIVTLTYDANDNLLSLTDPVSNVTGWLYDALDRKIQETDPLSNSSTFAYDAADRITSATDRNGQLISYSYDLLNRETGENWYNTGGTQVNSLTFTYDANGNLLTALSGSVVTSLTYANTMAYDALDRRASVQGPFGTVLTYSYDAANNRTLVQDSFGGITTRVYDPLNRVTTIMFDGSSQTPLREDFSYTPRDQVASQTRYSDLAGTSKIGSSSFTYDSVGRLTNLQHLDGSGVNIANYTNTYDLASRVTSETLNGGAPTSYSYDAVNELTNDSVVTYTYDLNGNRTMSGYSTGSANELTSDGSWDYYYDKNGNVVGKTNPSTSETFSYGYDNRNRLVTAQDTTSSGVQMLATYVYDAQGQRIEQDVWTQSSGTTATTRFAYDRREIWVDLDSTNALQTCYVRGARVLELLVRISSGGAVAWFLADRLASIRNVVDNSGSALDAIDYDGYGNAVSETNPANGGPYKYAGYRFDSETGFYRPDATVGRIYAPSIGVWLGRDALGFLAGDANLHRYVGNAPTLAVDPLGLLTKAAECKRAFDQALRQCYRYYNDGMQHAFKMENPLRQEYLARYRKEYRECKERANGNYQSCLHPPVVGGGGVQPPGGLAPAQPKPCPPSNKAGGHSGTGTTKSSPTNGKGAGKGSCPVPDLYELRRLLESEPPNVQLATVLVLGGELPPWLLTVEAAPPVGVAVGSQVLIGVAIAIQIEIALREARRCSHTPLCVGTSTCADFGCRALGPSYKCEPIAGKCECTTKLTIDIP